MFDGVYVAGYYVAGFNTDAYLRKFNTSGDYQWSHQWGCGALGFDASMSSDSDGMGNVYVAGYFSNEVDFDPGSGIKNLTSQGERDCFLLKFSPSGSYTWAMSFGSVLEDYAFGVGVAQNHYVYVTGRFEHTVDFDPGMGDDFHTSNGWYDAYLVKFSPEGYW